MISVHNRGAALLAVLVTAVLAAAAPARADLWDEQTELTFSSAILVPGTTLAPGTYVVSLADTDPQRNLVRIERHEDGKLVALVQAVPMRRSDPNADTVLTFTPTDLGTPALKGWFYPGSVYGHELVYPDDQAKHIADRTKTVVLSKLKKPLLVADRIVDADNHSVLLMSDGGEGSANPSARAAGEGRSVNQVIVDPGMLGSGTRDLVGRSVDVRAVRVLRAAAGGGFFVDVPGGAVLVLPTLPMTVSVAPGDRVSVVGAVAAAPRRAAERVDPPAGWNNRIYVAALSVTK